MVSLGFLKGALNIRSSKVYNIGDISSIFIHIEYDASRSGGFLGITIKVDASLVVQSVCLDNIFDSNPIRVPIVAIFPFSPHHSSLRLYGWIWRNV